MVDRVNKIEALVDGAIKAFEANPGEVTMAFGEDPESAFELKVIQKMELVANPKKEGEIPKGSFYAYVWTTDKEAKYLKTLLAKLAKLGLVVAVSKPIYQNLKQQDIRRARLVVKEFTRHNDKLGFDYSITQSGYYASYSEQFSESAYGGERGFLAEAAKFYREKNLRDTAEHFESMSQKFNTKASTRQSSISFDVPDDLQAQRLISGYLSQIEDLNLRLRQSEDTLESTRRELQDSQDTVKGYHDSVVLAPHQVVDFPQQLRNNVRRILDHLQTTDETRFMKSLLDPFHPHALGVRVPTRVPRNTITYNTHSEYTFKATNAVTDVMYINNFEQMSGHYYVAVEGDAVQNFLVGTPVQLEDAKLYEDDNQVFDVTYVPVGKANQLTVKYIKDDTWHDNFFKLRCVAGGMRVLKTSKQESESGSLDMIYSRDGSSFDEGHSFKTDLARARPDRVRTYLANAGCCLRQTNGFVIQSNKRPHDEASLELLDVKKMNNSKGHNFAPHGHTSSVWFIDIANKKLVPPEEVGDIFGTNEVGIVLESLQQRHTSMALALDLQPGMTLSFESIYHLEGLADQTAYGFTQATSAKLRSAATSLQLLDVIPTERIFAPYSVRRPELLELILNQGQVRGFWDETMFPAIKDMIRYGADTLAESEFLDDVIDAVVDSAAGTLGYMAPQFLPAIMAASEHVKDPLHNAAQDALKAASDWSKRIKGIQPANTGYRQLMIDTCQPSYGSNVLGDAE